MPFSKAAKSWLHLNFLAASHIFLFSDSVSLHNNNRIPSSTSCHSLCHYFTINVIWNWCRSTHVFMNKSSWKSTGHFELNWKWINSSLKSRRAFHNCELRIDNLSVVNKMNYSGSCSVIVMSTIPSAIWSNDSSLCPMHHLKPFNDNVNLQWGAILIYLKI